MRSGKACPSTPPNTMRLNLYPGRAALLKLLGPRTFDDDGGQVGNFWTMIETRPYMRVLQAMVRIAFQKDDYNKSACVNALPLSCPHVVETHLQKHHDRDVAPLPRRQHGSTLVARLRSAPSRPSQRRAFLRASMVAARGEAHGCASSARRLRFHRSFPSPHLTCGVREDVRVLPRRASVHRRPGSV